MAFRASYARDVVLPLAQAAYTAMSGAAHLAALPDQHPPLIAVQT